MDVNTIKSCYLNMNIYVNSIDEQNYQLDVVEFHLQQILCLDLRNVINDIFIVQ